MAFAGLQKQRCGQPLSYGISISSIRASLQPVWLMRQPDWSSRQLGWHPLGRHSLGRPATGTEGRCRGRFRYTASVGRVAERSGERYVYPDVSVVCGPVLVEAGTSDVITNPTILVEVISGSTEQYDRGQKWEGYQRLTSLSDYVLVSQPEAPLAPTKVLDAGRVDLSRGRPRRTSRPVGRRRAGRRRHLRRRLRAAGGLTMDTPIDARSRVSRRVRVAVARRLS